MRKGFYIVQTVFSITYNNSTPNLLTGIFVHFLLSPKKLTLYDLYSLLNYADTKNFLISHLLLVMHNSLYKLMSLYVTHTHTHTHTHIHTHTQRHTHTHLNLQIISY